MNSEPEPCEKTCAASGYLLTNQHLPSSSADYINPDRRIQRHVNRLSAEIHIIRPSRQIEMLAHGKEAGGGRPFPARLKPAARAFVIPRGTAGLMPHPGRLSAHR